LHTQGNYVLATTKHQNIFVRSVRSCISQPALAMVDSATYKKFTEIEQLAKLNKAQFAKATNKVDEIAAVTTAPLRRPRESEESGAPTEETDQDQIAALQAQHPAKKPNRGAQEEERNPESPPIVVKR